jgi:hypothetical protein
MFSYSKGKSKFDNLPEQRNASTFKEFAKDILYSVSEKKGQTYVCASVSCGHHNKIEKFPRKNYWRQQHLARPRRYLAFDLDEFETPEVFDELREKFPWDGFMYTTASHTSDEPRARAFVQLSREVDHAEGVELGEASQAYLESLVTSGKIKFDKSVYYSTQPIYTPVKGFTPFRTKGEILDVDCVLTQYRAQNTEAPSKKMVTRLKQSRKASNTSSDISINPKKKIYLPLDDTPNNNAWLENFLSRRVSADRPREEWKRIVLAIMSTGFTRAESIAYDWSTTSDRYTDTDFTTLVSDYRDGVEGEDGCVSIGTIYHYAEPYSPFTEEAS